MQLVDPGEAVDGGAKAGGNGPEGVPPLYGVGDGPAAGGARLARGDPQHLPGVDAVGVLDAVFGGNGRDGGAEATGDGPEGVSPPHGVGGGGHRGAVDRRAGRGGPDPQHLPGVDAAGVLDAVFAGNGRDGGAEAAGDGPEGVPPAHSVGDGPAGGADGAAAGVAGQAQHLPGIDEVGVLNAVEGDQSPHGGAEAAGNGPEGVPPPHGVAAAVGHRCGGGDGGQRVAVAAQQGLGEAV